MRNAYFAAAILLAFTALSSPAMAGLSLGGSGSGNAGVSLGGGGVGAGAGAGANVGTGIGTGIGGGASAGTSTRTGLGFESGGTVRSLHHRGGKTRAEIEADVYGGADSVLGTAGEVEGEVNSHTAGQAALPGIGADAEAGAEASGTLNR